MTGLPGYELQLQTESSTAVRDRDYYRTSHDCRDGNVDLLAC